VSERILGSNLCDNGSPFHTDGPTTENARAWVVEVRAKGTKSNHCSDEQSELRPLVLLYSILALYCYYIVLLCCCIIAYCIATLYNYIVLLYGRALYHYVILYCILFPLIPQPGNPCMYMYLLRLAHNRLQWQYQLRQL